MSNNFNEFIQELESDLRQEKFEKLWKQYGKSIIAGFLVIVGLSGAFNLWQNHQKKQRDIISQQFLTAQTLLFDKKFGDALSAMEGISKSSHNTYAALAKLSIAGILRQDIGYKDSKRAEDIYHELMNSSGTDQLLRELARILYIAVRLERMPRQKGTEELDELYKSLDPYTKETSPYRHIALELKGSIELQQNDLARASETFVKLAQDDKAPRDLRYRAQLVTQGLAAQLARNTQKAR